MSEIEKLIKEMTLEEKADLLSGYTNMSTAPIKRLGINSIIFSDGPNGLRKEKGEKGIDNFLKTEETTCFPDGINLASTFDKDLIKKTGVALGEECSFFGVNVLLGPAVNIDRNPLDGRNFEYYSEDPYLTSQIGINYVLGLQSQKVSCCVKHFALNNNENSRFTSNAICDERALREIYLKPFEMIVKNAHPLAFMTSYNQVNGFHSSENSYLISDVLRNEWDFDGVVMTDWGGIVNKAASVKAGNDLEMPGMVSQNKEELIKSINDKTLPIEYVDKAIANILTLGERTKAEKAKDCDFKGHEEICYQIALGSAVLLKNNNQTLPLDSKKKYLVIGSLFEDMRYQGSGSSMINAKRVVTTKEAFDENHISYEYAPGYNCHSFKSQLSLENEAINKAKSYDEILFFGGLIDGMESEGFDRDDLNIPHNQVKLIQKLGKLHKKIVFVLYTGNAIELPFIDKFSAVLNMQLPGEMGGLATYSLLFGKASPSGRMSITWPLNKSDIPFESGYGLKHNDLYKESIYVGYRYYTTFKKAVLYPFGYGLSYSSFAYSELNVKSEQDNLLVSLKVKNTGTMKAKEVVQVYFEHSSLNTDFPLRQLIGFDKVELDINEEKEVKFILPLDSLKYYSLKEKRTVLDDGLYTIDINKDANTVLLSSPITLKGENIKEDPRTDYQSADKLLAISDDRFYKISGRQPQKYIPGGRPITFETPIREYTTFFGKIFRKVAIHIGKSKMKEARKEKDPNQRRQMEQTGLFISKMIPSNCLRSLCYCSGGIVTYPMAVDILDIVNGHPIKGLKALKKDMKKQ